MLSATLATGALSAGAPAASAAGPAAASARTAVTAVAGIGADPVLVPWSSLAPALALGYDPGSSNICRRGDIRCVDAWIREMYRRFDPLARSCDHDAIFSLVYLRTTEEYRRAVLTPGFFDDPSFLNYYDATFANAYFVADTDWRAGRTAKVPPAWRTAFAAADRGEVSASGNMLLGINAHINRDLPFVLESIGLTAPDGTSRKRDHDQVNVFLLRVGESELRELARRFDPTADDGEADGDWDDSASFQLIETWRERAWRNAERLVAARKLGPAAYAATAESIEANADAEAQTILAATRYAPGSTARQERDAYCAVHWNDA